MLSPMFQQCSTGFVQLFFESIRFLVIFGGHNQALERIDKPAVPERGDAVFRVQVFEIRAVHHVGSHHKMQVSSVKFSSHDLDPAFVYCLHHPQTRRRRAGKNFLADQTGCHDQTIGNYLMNKDR